MGGWHAVGLDSLQHWLIQERAKTCTDNISRPRATSAFSHHFLLCPMRLGTLHCTVSTRTESSLNSPSMSNTLAFDELWNQALENYLVSTRRTVEDRAVLKKLHSPEDLHGHLEADYHKFGKFREKHSKLSNTLSKAMRPFMVVSGAVSSALSVTPFAPASVVLGSVLFLLDAAGGVSEAYDWIEQLFDKLGGFIQRFEEYVQGEINTHLQQKVIAILACLLEILALSEQTIKDGRFKKYAAVLFLGKDEQVKASFSKLEMLFDDEHRLVQAITYATNQKIDKKTADIDKTTKKTLETAERLDAKVDDIFSRIQGTKLNPARV